MADKYIIQGATYNGDGTTSAEAASAGAAGAWNHVNIITGTALSYGTLVAGDTVYIRSKTAAGADLTITTAANSNVGKASLTGTQWVRWVLDNGAIWAGINGTLTFSMTAAISYTVLAGNILEAITQDAIAFTSFAGSHAGTSFSLPKTAKCIRVLVSTSENTINGGNIYLRGWMLKPHLRCGIRYTNWIYNAENGVTGVLVDPDIELLNSAETDPVFSASGLGGNITCYGGRIRGAGAVSSVPISVPPTTINFGTLSLYGLNYPYSMPLTNLAGWAVGASVQIVSIGSDGALGSTLDSYAGRIDSRRDGNYPTCNATLPDSVGTAWSFLITPRGAQPFAPLTLPISKLYSSADAIKTITLELLVGTLFSEINKSNCWAEIAYTDATSGVRVLYTTNDKAAGALTTSTTTWSATTYGSVSFDKRKIEFTTPTSIKQDTQVVVQFFITQPQIQAAEDLIILCPDVQLS